VGKAALAKSGTDWESGVKIFKTRVLSRNVALFVENVIIGLGFIINPWVRIAFACGGEYQCPGYVSSW
jgi:hypothetical protein